MTISDLETKFADLLVSHATIGNVDAAQALQIETLTKQYAEFAKFIPFLEKIAAGTIGPSAPAVISQADKEAIAALVLQMTPEEIAQAKAAKQMAGK